MRDIRISATSCVAAIGAQQLRELDAARGRASRTLASTRSNGGARARVARDVAALRGRHRPARAQQQAPGSARASGSSSTTSMRASNSCALDTSSTLIRDTQTATSVGVSADAFELTGARPARCQRSPIVRLNRRGEGRDRCWLYLAAVTAVLSADVAATPRPARRRRSSRSIRPIESPDRAPALPVHGARDGAGDRGRHRLVPAPRQRRALGPRDASGRTGGGRCSRPTRSPSTATTSTPTPSGTPSTGPSTTRSRAGTAWARRGVPLRRSLASTFWEYFVEIPENPSLNDMILTPDGGRDHRRGDVPAGAVPRAERTGRRALHGRAAVRAGRDAERPAALPRAARGSCRRRGWGWRSASTASSSTASTTRDELALDLGSEMVSNRAYERPGDGQRRGGSPGQWVSLYGDGRFGAGPARRRLVPRAGRSGAAATIATTGSIAGETDVPDRRAGARAGARCSAWAASSTTGCAICRAVHDRIAIGRHRSGRCSSCPRRGVYLRAVAVGAVRVRDHRLDGVSRGLPYAARAGHQDVAARQRLLLRAGRGVGGDAGARPRTVGFVADARGAWYWSIDDGDPAQSTIQRDVMLHDSRVLPVGRDVDAARRSAASASGWRVEHVRRASNMLDINVHGTRVRRHGDDGDRLLKARAPRRQNSKPTRPDAFQLCIEFEFGGRRHAAANRSSLNVAR